MDNKNRFNDIKNHWAESVINEAYDLALVEGYDDGTFKPDQQCSRAEVTVLGLNIYKQLEILIDKKKVKPTIPTRTIVVDAGHGGKDRANIDPFGLGYVEADGNLKFCLALKKYLSPYFKVILTRETDIFLTWTERAMVAVNNKADMFVSIHSDAYKKNIGQGVTVFDSVARKNEALGSKIGLAIAEANNTVFRGVKERPSTFNPILDYYTVMNVAQVNNVPIIFLIERGFHTYFKDCQALLDTDMIELSAKSMANEVIAYYSKNT